MNSSDNLLGNEMKYTFYVQMAGSELVESVTVLAQNLTKAYTKLYAEMKELSDESFKVRSVDY